MKTHWYVWALGGTLNIEAHYKVDFRAFRGLLRPWLFFLNADSGHTKKCSRYFLFKKSLTPQNPPKKKKCCPSFFIKKKRGGAFVFTCFTDFFDFLTFLTFLTF